LTSLEARPQTPLSAARCARLALDGMRYRLLRSAVTMATLGLAVAFAVFAGGGAVLQQRTTALAASELAPSIEARRWLSRLRAPDEPATILRALQQRDPERLGEYAGGLGGDDGATQQLARAGAAAREFALWEAWVRELEPAAAAALLGGEPLRVALDRWVGDEAWTRFLDRLDQWGRRPPGERADVARAFVVERWPALRDALDAVRAGHARALAALAAGPPAATDLLPERSRLTQAGFLIDETTWQRVRDAAEADALRARTIEAIRRAEVRSALARAMGTDRNAVSLDAVMAFAADRPDPATLVELLDDDLITPAALHTLAVDTLRRQRLEALLPPDMDPGLSHASPALPRATLALLALSLLVCVVGVGNAMLMSVTERFTEIATMKCLGALDGSIMTVFVMEAVILGLVGTAAGITLGAALAVTRSLLASGGVLLETPGVGVTLGQAALVSASLGLFLAVLAALGPSLAAARLAPMEAMRVE
jgi:hypothetical protein